MRFRWSLQTCWGVHKAMWGPGLGAGDRACLWTGEGRGWSKGKVQTESQKPWTSGDHSLVRVWPEDKK